MKKLPTDLQILNSIYERYYETFAQFSRRDKSRSSKVYVPIEVTEISADLSVDTDIIFGRLYYHLDKKHGYEHDDGTKVPLFTLRVGEDTHCVNFPLMAAVLADLRDQAKKHNTVIWIAIGSFLLSAIAVMISIYVFLLKFT